MLYISLSFLLEPYCIGEYVIEIITSYHDDTNCSQGGVVTATVTVDKVCKNVSL